MYASEPNVLHWKLSELLKCYKIINIHCTILWLLFDEYFVGHTGYHR